MQTEHKTDKKRRRQKIENRHNGGGGGGGGGERVGKRVEYLELEQTMKFNGSPKILLEWKTVGMFTYFQFHIGQRLSLSQLSLYISSHSLCRMCVFRQFWEAIEMSLLLISLARSFRFLSHTLTVVVFFSRRMNLSVSTRKLN